MEHSVVKAKRSPRQELAIRDHTVLPTTQQKQTRPALTPASKLVFDLPTPEGWKAELTYTGETAISSSTANKGHCAVHNMPSKQPQNCPTIPNNELLLIGPRTGNM